MIDTSRKRGYSAETIIETAAVNTNSASSTGINPDQVHEGEIPNASTNTNATTRFSARLKSAVNTTAIGITSRGNCVLRTTASWPTIDPTAIVDASWKNPNRTMLNSRNAG